jgi:hypothetical protein
MQFLTFCSSLTQTVVIRSLLSGVKHTLLGKKSKCSTVVRLSFTLWNVTHDSVKEMHLASRGSSSRFQKKDNGKNQKVIVYLCAFHSFDHFDVTLHRS